MLRRFVVLLPLAGATAPAGCGYSVHDDHSTETSATSTGAGSATTATTASTASGSSTTSPSTESSTDSTSTGCPGPDLSDPDPPTWGCDPIAQDCLACQKCAPYDSDRNGAWDSVRCVPATGEGVHGDPCTTEAYGSGLDDCALGYMCWGVDEETKEGTCVAHCGGTFESLSCEHQPDTTCMFASGGVLFLCLNLCDPLAPTCASNEVCISDTMGEYFVCVIGAPSGQSPVGAECEYSNGCHPGLLCLDASFAQYEGCEGWLGCCTPFCDVTLGDGPCQDLNPSFKCVAWHEQGEAPVGLEDVGVCGVPW